MKWMGLAVVPCLARLGFGTEPSPMQRLQAKVRVNPVGALTPANLAGKYSNPPKEFSPALSGNSLYLFPDGTYIYDDWADIQPLTIYDKGEWRIENDTIVLHSDKDVSWDPDVERRYIAVARQGHPGEILLLGINTALTRFEADRDVEPEIALMTFVKERRMELNKRSNAAKIKKKLLRTEWNPAYFGKK